MGRLTEDGSRWGFDQRQERLESHELLSEQKSHVVWRKGKLALHDYEMV